jgi:hypothetical protein
MRFEYHTVNVYKSATRGFVITGICDDQLSELFKQINEWFANNIPVRIEKKFVNKYADIFNMNGWNIDPRDWNSDNPLRFCRYASVETFLYISPTIYD